MYSFWWALAPRKRAQQRSWKVSAYAPPPCVSAESRQWRQEPLPRLHPLPRYHCYHCYRKSCPLRYHYRCHHLLRSHPSPLFVVCGSLVQVCGYWGFHILWGFVLYIRALFSMPRGWSMTRARRRWILPAGRRRTTGVPLLRYALARLVSWRIRGPERTTSTCTRARTALLVERDSVAARASFQFHHTAAATAAAAAAAPRSVCRVLGVLGAERAGA